MTRLSGPNGRTTLRNNTSWKWVAAAFKATAVAASKDTTTPTITRIKCTVTPGGDGHAELTLLATDRYRAARATITGLRYDGGSDETVFYLTVDGAKKLAAFRMDKSVDTWVLAFDGSSVTVGDDVIVPATDDHSYPPVEKLFDHEYTETTSHPFNPRYMADGWTAAGLMTDRDKPVRFHANSRSASLIETEDIDGAGRMRRYEYLILPVFPHHAQRTGLDRTRQEGPTA